MTMFLITQLTIEHINHKDRLTVELSANGDTFYQSWLQLTYDRQYTSEILKLAEYLYTPLNFAGLN